MLPMIRSSSWRLQSSIVLSAAVRSLKPLCRTINAGVHRGETTSLFPDSAVTSSEDSRIRLLATIPDSSDAAVSAECCTNRVVLSGVVSEVSTGFANEIKVVQFVLDDEFAVRCPTVDAAQIEWVRSMTGREVVVTGRLKYDLHIDYLSGKIYQFPHVWINPESLEAGSMYLLPANA